MAIEVVNRQRRTTIDEALVGELVERTLRAVGRTGRDLTVAFVNDALIRRLNRDFRGKDQPTDVLSFPAGDETGSLGDVVISTQTVMAQAGRLGHSVRRELGELVIHGVLHLCGYDHDADDGQMDRLELRLRRALLSDD